MVDNLDFVFRDVEEVDKVALGLNADSDDDVSSATGVTELEAVNPAVDGFEKLGITNDDKVVHSDDTFDVFRQPIRQFVTEAVEDLDPLVNDSMPTAKGSPKAGKESP